VPLAVPCEKSLIGQVEGEWRWRPPDQSVQIAAAAVTAGAPAVRDSWEQYINRRLARRARHARRHARRCRVIDDTLPSWEPSFSRSAFSFIFLLCFSRPVPGPGIMDDDAADNDLQMAAVLGD